MNEVTPRAHYSFYALGIAPKILEVLERMKLTVPTPIQHKAIPIAIQGKDIVGVAQTGTGKTLAFAVPIIQRLSRVKGRCLVITPTRELALQIDEVFREIARFFNLKTAVIIGGASMPQQLKILKLNPRILIATPGRLVDHMERGTVFLWDVNVLVLDEADRMLDMGFLPQVERILKNIPRRRQTMLFSATIPQEIVNIAAAHMKLPVHVEVAPSGTMPKRITHELFIVKKAAKKQLLSKILRQYHGPVLLFSRTKFGARKIRRLIRGMGHSVAEIHSDRSLPQRREALDGFKVGKYRVLVATDVASRGLDVRGIELVINYDLPDDTEQYLHRIGRTGRAGSEGRAISFATPEQGEDVRNIEKFIKTALPVSLHPELPRERFIPEPKPPRSYQGYGRQRNRRYRPGSHRRYRSRFNK
ncbi:DEAD/DEAH box helicase [bacterium]|nr:DEAD/DEAH box helicase [bacterium]